MEWEIILFVGDGALDVPPFSTTNIKWIWFGIITYLSTVIWGMLFDDKIYLLTISPIFDKCVFGTSKEDSPSVKGRCPKDREVRGREPVPYNNITQYFLFPLGTNSYKIRSIITIIIIFQSCVFSFWQILFHNQFIISQLF